MKKCETCLGFQVYDFQAAAQPKGKAKKRRCDAELEYAEAALESWQTRYGCRYIFFRILMAQNFSELYSQFL